MSYLTDLTFRMAAGAESFSTEMRELHTGFLLAREHADGGFTGREGEGDLYYTSFALRALGLLGTFDEALAERTAAWLGDQLDRPLPSIDFLSLATSAVLVEMASGADVFAQAGRDRKQTVVEFFERFRRPDGGYAKTERGGQASTYHTFLVAGCLELVEAPQGDVEPMIETIRGRQRDDGGFVELGPLRQSGTNPTAAAVGLLRMLNALDEPHRTAAADFLAGMQMPDGGIRANTRVPIGDLLSTFTALVALVDLDAAHRIDSTAVRRFADSAAMPGGGFRAAAWDEMADVEYTFYGLGTLALLGGLD